MFNGTKNNIDYISSRHDIEGNIFEPKSIIIPNTIYIYDNLKYQLCQPNQINSCLYLYVLNNPFKSSLTYL